MFKSSFTYVGKFKPVYSVAAASSLQSDYDVTSIFSPEECFSRGSSGEEVWLENGLQDIQKLVPHLHLSEHEHRLTRTLRSECLGKTLERALRFCFCPQSIKIIYNTKFVYAGCIHQSNNTQVSCEGVVMGAGVWVPRTCVANCGGPPWSDGCFGGDLEQS